jgi:predicted kinase
MEKVLTTKGRSEKMIPRLIFLVGVPGSGKSTWLCTHIFDPKLLRIVSPDNIRKELYGDISDQVHNVEIMEMAKIRTINSLNNGISVILDATNLKAIYRQQFIDGLPLCKLQAVLFEATPEQCWERVKKDIDSGKDRAKVPEEKIYSMYEEYLSTKKIIESEGFEIIVSL